MCVAAAGATIASLTLSAPVVGRTGTFTPWYTQGSSQVEGRVATSVIRPVPWDLRALSAAPDRCDSSWQDPGHDSGGSRTLVHSCGCHKRRCVAPRWLHLHPACQRRLQRTLCRGLPCVT